MQPTTHPTQESRNYKDCYHILSKLDNAYEKTKDFGNYFVSVNRASNKVVMIDIKNKGGYEFRISLSDEEKGYHVSGYDGQLSNFRNRDASGKDNSHDIEVLESLLTSFRKDIESIVAEDLGLKIKKTAAEKAADIYMNLTAK